MQTKNRPEAPFFCTFSGLREIPVESAPFRRIMFDFHRLIFATRRSMQSQQNGFEGLACLQS
jgi:hypothetical protein